MSNSEEYVDKRNIKGANVFSQEALNKGGYTSDGRDKDKDSITKSPQRLSNASSDFEKRRSYYKMIQKKGNFNKTFLDTPSHVLNANIFYISPLFGGEDAPEVGEKPDPRAPKKAKSWMTIISVWNTMIGSTLVSLPWAIRRAGLIPSIVFSFIYAYIMYYTSYIIVKTGKDDKDFTDTISTYFGKLGKVGGVTYIIFCNLINIGAIFIFFLIINQNLFPVLGWVANLFGADVDLDNGVPSFSYFSIMYCGIIVACAVYPLINFKEMTVIMKLNSYGIYFSSVLLGFVIFYFFYSIANTTFDFQLLVNTKADSTRHLYLFGEDPLKLAGTLSMGLFCHSFILPMMKNNEKQENNKRDLFIGYVLVCFTYIIVGIAGYVGFSGASFEPELTTKIDNFFKYFDSSNGLILFLKVLNVIQLLTIMPVVCFIVRVQLFGTFFKEAYPSKKIVYSFNLVLLLLCLLVLFLCYNLLGRLIGIIGTFTGLFLVYLIPLSINILYYKRKHPDKYIDREETVNNLSNNSLDTWENTKDDGKSGTADEQLMQKVVAKKEKQSTPLKDKVFYITNVLLMLVGFFNLITQFVPINLFSIEIKQQ